jgi:DSC E3 ubiquitin ligase complex subunit 3, ubiquitin-like domain/DSC E3 ubiquitin ligase complex subunit 3, C-terminal domain
MDQNASSPGSSKPRHERLASCSTRPPGPSPPPIPFCASIRFSSSSLTDLEITIPDVNDTPPPTVTALKEQIRYLRPLETYNRRLRLILAGKVLNDHSPLKAIESNRVRRPSIPLSPPSVKGKEKETTSDRLWIHCSMGEPLSDKEFEEEERDKQTQSTLPLAVGFDRLRSAGFSEDDIASLRAQFQRFHRSRSEDADSVDVTAMEERWLDEMIGMGGSASIADGGCSQFVLTLTEQHPQIHMKRHYLGLSLVILP